MLRVWSREKLKIGRKEGRVVRVGERGEGRNLREGGSCSLLGDGSK